MNISNINTRSTTSIFIPLLICVNVLAFFTLCMFIQGFWFIICVGLFTPFSPFYFITCVGLVTLVSVRNG